MKFTFFCLVMLLLTVPVLCLSGEMDTKNVVCSPVEKAMVLDGQVSDWNGIAATKVQVTPAVNGDAKNYTGIIDVEVRAAVHGDTIFVLAQWPDDSQDITHKTLHWNKDKDIYEEGADLEDRLALSFDMGGDFTACMLGGTEYKADVWHWKAFRSQSAGLAHDKMHILSYDQMPKAKKHPGRNGKEVWLLRPSDQGDKLYKSQRPLDNIGASIPRYLVNSSPQGSVADVKAAAKWEKGNWTLELSRKMDTGNSDDVKFKRGQTYKAALAVFNHTGDDHHSSGGFVLDIR